MSDEAPTRGSIGEYLDYMEAHDLFVQAERGTALALAIEQREKEGRRVRVEWYESRGMSTPTLPDYGVIYTHTPPRVDDDAKVKVEPFSLIAEDGLGPSTIAAPSSWACHTITSGRLWDGDLLATYRRARAQVVDTIAAGLRDAGLTDEATIERLTEAVVKRLGEGT